LGICYLYRRFACVKMTQYNKLIITDDRPLSF
jgi:hypothetical protein